ncbi:hypothetical protein [Chryseosolibacter indicus]|uniref:Beta-lactamase-inhibitor-like PepSY-like domain-containing protein n=1 Tax=Chryseosolibacter indicus TaxID=2782351 RepID=A0ABS5VLD5_9BACT|nr:hypothetical protein [Chryseosolibacter indicus]MBT1701921.1 hypothetical protein [Chryseosolibacter indicus]
MKLFALALLVISMQDIAFKEKEHFEVKLDYQFKIRPVQERVWAASEKSRSTESLLPYLVVNINMLQFSEGEVRVRIINNKSTSQGSKKIYEGMAIPVVVGFTDDAKDRVTAHEYQVIFLDEKKSPLSRIVIFIEDDGTFYVNGEKRGRL